MNAKKIKIISFIAIILVITIVNYLEPSSEEINQEAYDLLKYDQYFGTIENKFLDKNNHYHPTVILRNIYGEHKILLVRDQSGAYDYLDVGDSINKKYGSYELKILKSGKDSIFTLTYAKKRNP